MSRLDPVAAAVSVAGRLRADVAGPILRAAADGDLDAVVAALVGPLERIAVRPGEAEALRALVDLHDALGGLLDDAVARHADSVPPSTTGDLPSGDTSE